MLKEVKEFKELEIQLNKEFKKIIDYVESKSEMFDYMDLKLHNASYYAHKEEVKIKYPYIKDFNDEFYRFCEINYQSMIDCLNWEYDINFNDYHNQLRHTSSFYLHDGNIIDIDRRGGLDGDRLITHLINYYFYHDFCYNYIYFNFDKDNNINLSIHAQFDEEEMKEVNEEMKDFIVSIYDMFLKMWNDNFKNVEVIYNYIKDFKDNQVLHFNDYLESENEYFKIEEEEEKKKEDKHNQKADIIINKCKNILNDEELKIIENLKIKY